MKTLFALLVGIDAYTAPIPTLRGCVNDVHEIKALLDARVSVDGKAPEDVCKITLLENQQATRDAVIRGFREHLGQAGPEDVALFYYSGHGSQERAPEAFWHLESDHMNETLVCYDSRSDGSWDLADKELAKLIRDVAAGGAHVVVILDCCHSGSGTRKIDQVGTSVRRAEADPRLRPLSSFILSTDEMNLLSAERSGLAKASGWHIAGRHVLLAACRDDEEAKEYNGGGATRGAFSYFLGQTLQTVGGNITYRDLFARANALVRAQVQRQSPQLEATDNGDLDRPFLGGVIRPRSHYFVASARSGHWSIDAGRVDGIPAATADDRAVVALFDFTASDDQLKDQAKAVGKATITRVGPANSDITIDGPTIDLSRAPLKAVLLHLPIPRLAIQLEGDEAGLTLARQALAAAAPGGGASPFVREAAVGEAASYRLIARAGEYLIARSADDRPLVGEITGFTAESAAIAITRLEHIERWTSTAELQNPNSSIAADELTMEIEVLCGQTDPSVGAASESDIRVTYIEESDGQWINPEIKIRLKNNGKRNLYVAALDLPQTFGIFALFDQAGCQRLGLGEVVYARSDEPIPLTIPDSFWERGVVELKDIIKVVVCTTEFNANRMVQDDLDLPRDRGVARGLEQLGTLDALMERVQTRHADEKGTRRLDDWRTLQTVFTTVRPLAAAQLKVGMGADLGQGVRIEPHATLAVAEVRLGSMPAASRSVGAIAPLPRLLYEDPSIVQPFELTTTRSLDNVINVLELSGIKDPTLVTYANPLTLIVPRPLGAGEHVLPVAFDGEFYVPLGRAEPAGNQTRVILDRLPQLSEASSKSLGGAARIYFQKVVSKFIGTKYPYPLLAVADVDDAFEVQYEFDPAKVRDRVAKAKRIVLFVHGIIGDTRGMAPSVRRANVSGKYDLILTFDYESFNDSITKTARSLKQRLADVGLGSDHGKEFEIVAHSMGGLVSRWFIEREGGNRVVDRLMMVGTPNNGSPWPTVEDWATTLLAFGLNGLAHFCWPSAVLGWLVKGVNHAGIALAEMAPDSEFLRALYVSPDPKIPYLLISGNTSLIPPTPADAERRLKIARLLRKLWSAKTKYELANKFFADANNDIAVSTDSMGYIPGGRELPMTIYPAACDHVSYFTDPAGLKALGANI